MTDRLLVTGATGFLGTWTLRHWRGRHPDVELWATSNEPWVGEPEAENFVQLDLCDRKATRNFVCSHKPTEVIHLAGLIGDAELADHLRVNVIGTENLYQALLEAGTTDDLRIVQASSAATYGMVQPEELPIVEEQPPRPVSAYALSKLTQDYLAAAMWRKHGLQIMCGRVFNVLGPGQPEALVPMAFLKRLRDVQDGVSDRLRVGNSSSRRDFVDVRDVVTALEALLRRGAPGEVYNVGSGKDVSIQGIIDELLRISGSKVTVESESSLWRATDVPRVRADIRKISSATGWAPKIPLDESLETMWRRYLEVT